MQKLDSVLRICQKNGILLFYSGGFYDIERTEASFALIIFAILTGKIGIVYKISLKSVKRL